MSADPITVVGPVITTGMYDVATLALRREIEADLASQASKVASDWAKRFEHRVREAYMAGLRDGYAQGALVAHYDDSAAKSEEQA